MAKGNPEQLGGETGMQSKPAVEEIAIQPHLQRECT